MPAYYDSHAHLISDDLEKYPRNPIPFSMDDVPEDHPFGPGVIGFPGGLHGEKPNNLKPTAEQLHRWMAEENVVGIAAVQKGMIYRTDNSYITDAAMLFPDQMRAVIIINPDEEGTLDMIREQAGRGAIGIRFFPMKLGIDKATWLSSERSLAVWRLAEELGLLVDIEAPGTDQVTMINIVMDMCKRFPNLNIVLDHVFLPSLKGDDFGLDAHFQRLTEPANVSVKWTSINMDVAYMAGVPADQVLRKVVDLFGADKVMWGSDIGTSSGSYKELVQRAVASTRLLSDEERQKVLHDTGQRIFGRAL